jgi:hypothetical protein
LGVNDRRWGIHVVAILRETGFHQG